MFISQGFTVAIRENNFNIFIIENITTARKINGLLLLDSTADYDGTNTAVGVPIDIFGIINVELVGMTANHNLRLYVFSEKL